MKKIITISVISALLITVSGCSDKAKEQQESEKPAASWTKPEPLNFKGKGMKINDPVENSGKQLAAKP